MQKMKIFLKAILMKILLSKIILFSKKNWGAMLKIPLFLPKILADKLLKVILLIAKLLVRIVKLLEIVNLLICLCNLKMLSRELINLIVEEFDCFYFGLPFFFFLYIILV